VLHEYGDLRGWPKTSGGRGLHVFVPIAPRWTFTQVRRAAIAVGRELERRMPDQVTTAWWKEERGEKIFVDYNQTARDRTIASAYSVRPARTPRSAPLRWDEGDEARPRDFDWRPCRIASPNSAMCTRTWTTTPSPSSTPGAGQPDERQRSRDCVLPDIRNAGERSGCSPAGPSTDD